MGAEEAQCASGITVTCTVNWHVNRFDPCGTGCWRAASVESASAALISVIGGLALLLEHDSNSFIQPEQP